MNPNTGHGHVYPRPDGLKARCGGPSMCADCARDQAQKIADQSLGTDAPGYREAEYVAMYESRHPISKIAAQIYQARHPEGMTVGMPKVTMPAEWAEFLLSRWKQP